MELKQLRTFLCAAQYGSFSKAAKQLGYTQAAITIQIQQLEEELQTHLFDRFPRHVALTAQGELLLVHANEILQASEAAHQALRSSDELEGTLRIGMIESVCSSLFPDLYKQFHERYPLVDLHVETASIATLLDYMNHNQVDLLYLMDKKIYDPAWIKVLEHPQDILFVAALDHPLAHKKQLHLADILKERLMLTERNASYRYALDQAACAKDLEVSCFLEIGDTAFLLEMVKQKLGISFLPRFAVAKDIQQGTLCVLEPCDFHLQVWQQVFYHRSKWLTSEMKAMIHILQQSFQEVI